MKYQHIARLKAVQPKTVRCRNQSLSIGGRTLILGILNVTPDSFSDGGRYDDPERALERAQKMVAQGADLIDIGGESARPGYTPVTIKEELERVIPVVKLLATHLDVPLSIDTSKAEVAARVLDAGAHIVND